MKTDSSTRPTWKLGIAFAGMSGLAFDDLCRNLLQHDFDWLWVVWRMATAGFGIWLAWFGIFRTASLQLLWGWMCLVAGLLVLVMLAAHFLGLLPFHVPLDRMPLVFALPVTGWLLVIDRDVARHRTHLRKLEDARCKLRLED